MQKQKRHHTQQSITKNLDKMIFLAAEQKLLPRIIYDYSLVHKNPQFANHYRDSVKQIYGKQTTKLLKYNEQQAKTHRQKFRQQIVKLMNNQLPIDYLKPVKVNGKYVMTFKGHPLEKVQYPTESSIFGDFTEDKFKKQYENIFEDKLQYQQHELLRQSKKQQKIKFKTQMSQVSSTKKIDNFSHKVQKLHSNQICSSTSPVSLPKLMGRSQLDRNKLLSPVNKKKPKVMIKNQDQQSLIHQIMMKIGKFSNLSQNISVTKESIIKYFRQFYSRPYKIVDFLQFNDVQTYQSFTRVPLRLKLMPNQHIYFMAFLFYDTNNDGYICNNDLMRIQQLAKKCPLVHQDCQIIKKQASKIKFESNINYMQLYRLSEITETTYFNWLKKDKSKAGRTSSTYQGELNDYFDDLNRKKIMIHFQGFKKIFQDQKPYLWYDILWRLSGTKYTNLKYQ